MLGKIDEGFLSRLDSRNFNDISSIKCENLPERNIPIEEESVTSFSKTTVGEIEHAEVSIYSESSLGLNLTTNNFGVQGVIKN